MQELIKKAVPLFLKSLLAFVLLTAGLTGPAWAGQSAGGATTINRLDIFGKIINTHNTGVAEAEVTVLLNNQVLSKKIPGRHENENAALITDHAGNFQGHFEFSPAGLEQGWNIEVRVSKPSYEKKTVTILPEQLLRDGGGRYMVRTDLQIKRLAGPAFWIATIIFVLAYILISFEFLHRTMAAMLGAALMLVISYTAGTLNPAYHIFSFESAIRSIDMNVILLLMGMMIIVGILKRTGLFQWCAYKCYQLSGGNITIMAIILMTFTAVTSAFLDNVTTMLLITPVSIEIAVALGFSPLALLIPEILASNIGGTATLIGDPPNIMIGSYAGLTFGDFVINLAPVCAIALVFLFLQTKLTYGKEFSRAKIADVPALIAKLREEYKITDSNLLVVGMIVMSIVLAMFITHGFWHMEVSIAALFGAALLFTYALLTGKVDLLNLIEKDIEWPTLLFFMFLFMLVGGVEQAGLLDVIADWVFRVSHGDLKATICLILWVSAIASAFVDNIPFTATMLPIVAYLSKTIPGADSNVLWWALAFGACFGGNGTMIGASANVVTLGIAESVGHPVRFFKFMKVGFLYMIISVAIANVWLLLYY